MSRPETGPLRILTLQLEGKNKQHIREIYNGYPGPFCARQMNLRAIAAKTICRVVDDGLTLDSAMGRVPACLSSAGTIAGSSRNFASARCAGSTKRSFLLEQYLKQAPEGAGTADIRILVLVGLYQLHYLDTPAHAAISETVNATVELGKDWAKPLVNALLRRSQREFQHLKPELDQRPRARYSHPDWLVDRIKADWPDLWEAILQANNQRPPQHLRLNMVRTSRENYLEELRQAGIQAQRIDLTPYAIHVLDPADVTRLPGFDDGRVSVQDAGAQLAATLLDLQPGNRVLDACAAPGGKTAHICETQPQIAGITALDIDEHRIARLYDNLTRLHHDATVIRTDAARTQTWWDGRLFDRILLDAPCSATGVIRRHPDIKRLKTPEQVPALRTSQAELLAALWPLLKPGGRLLYSTCSLLHDENDRVIDTFLENHPPANLETIRAEWGCATEYGRQLLPCLDDTDGFYYAVLRKL